MKAGFLLSKSKVNIPPTAPQKQPTQQKLPNPPVVEKTQQVTRPLVKAKEMEDIQPRYTPRARRLSLCLPKQNTPARKETLKALSNQFWVCDDIKPETDGVGNVAIYKLKENCFPAKECTFFERLKHRYAVSIIRDFDAPATIPLQYELSYYAENCSLKEILNTMYEKDAYIKVITTINIKEKDPARIKALKQLARKTFDDHKTTSRITNESTYTEKSKSLNKARSLGFNTIMGDRSCTLYVPDRDNLTHRYNELKRACEKTDPTRFKNLPEFDILHAEGILTDQEFILAYVTHTVVLAKFIENLHDSIFHVAPTYGQIIGTVDKGLSYDQEKFKLVKRLLPYIQRTWQIEMALRTDLKALEETSRKKIQKCLDQFRTQLALTTDYMAAEYSVTLCHDDITSFENQFIKCSEEMSAGRIALAKKKYQEKAMDVNQLSIAWIIFNKIGKLLTTHKKLYGSFQPNDPAFLDILNILQLRIP